MKKRGRPHGSGHKITVEQATEIRLLYTKGNVSTRTLAALYGCSHTTIAELVKTGGRIYDR